MLGSILVADSAGGPYDDHVFAGGLPAIGTVVIGIKPTLVVPGIEPAGAGKLVTKVTCGTVTQDVTNIGWPPVVMV